MNLEEEIRQLILAAKQIPIEDYAEIQERKEEDYLTENIRKLCDQLNSILQEVAEQAKAENGGKKAVGAFELNQFFMKKMIKAKEEGLLTNDLIIKLQHLSRITGGGEDAYNLYTLAHTINDVQLESMEKKVRKKNNAKENFLEEGDLGEGVLEKKIKETIVQKGIRAAILKNGKEQDQIESKFKDEIEQTRKNLLPEIQIKIKLQKACASQERHLINFIHTEMEKNIGLNLYLTVTTNQVPGTSDKLEKWMQQLTKEQIKTLKDNPNIPRSVHTVIEQYSVVNQLHRTLTDPGTKIEEKLNQFEKQFHGDKAILKNRLDKPGKIFLELVQSILHLKKPAIQKKSTNFTEQINQIGYSLYKHKPTKKDDIEEQKYKKNNISNKVNLP